MKQTPVIEIADRLRRLSLPHQIAHLQALVRTEPPRSVRRNELECLLQCKIQKQLRKEIRQDRRSA
jgi:hypothetical protein